jgi:hypothetical protein
LATCLVICTVVMTNAGCPEPPRQAGFLPKQQAMAKIQANRSLIDGGLKARGSARGHFLDAEGKRRHYDLIGKLQLVQPAHLRFVMENVLGRDELEVGMNDLKWWVFVRRPVETYREDWRDQDADVYAGSLPLQPNQLIHSLGLDDIAANQVAQRVVDDYQQLIFVDRTAEDPVIEREYWLDRFAPNQIRRVVFRDTDGRVTFTSELDGHAPVGDSGLLLPTKLRFRWPLRGAELVFRVDRWEVRPNLTADHRAFVSPHDRGARFEQEIINTR